MSYLNSRWAKLRATVEIGSASAALLVTGILSAATATAERGYHAAGGEVLLTAGAAALAGVVAHKVMDRAEVKLNAGIEADQEARRIRELCKANKVRMYTVDEERERRPRFSMFKIGEQ